MTCKPSAVKSTGRASGTRRWVFAVFYDGTLPQRPASYKLIEVRKETYEARELSPAESIEYYFRNYK